MTTTRARFLVLVGLGVAILVTLLVIVNKPAEPDCDGLSGADYFYCIEVNS